MYAFIKKKGKLLLLHFKFIPSPHTHTHKSLNTSKEIAWTKLLLDWYDYHPWIILPHCEEMFDSVLLCIKNAGSKGIGRVIEKLVSIRIMEAIVGLLATSSWTHNNPMWIHLIISVVEPAFNVGSTRFEAVPCFQFFHACKII